MNNDCLVQAVVDSLCLNLTFVTFFDVLSFVNNSLNIMQVSVFRQLSRWGGGFIGKVQHLNPLCFNTMQGPRRGRGW